MKYSIMDIFSVISLLSYILAVVAFNATEPFGEDAARIAAKVVSIVPVYVLVFFVPPVGIALCVAIVAVTAYRLHVASMFTVTYCIICAACFVMPFTYTTFLLPISSAIGVGMFPLIFVWSGSEWIKGKLRSSVIFYVSLSMVTVNALILSFCAGILILQDV